MLAPLRNNANRKAVVQAATVPAPTEGWDASTALAAMKPLRAVQLRNWFPQPGYLEVRRGFQRHAFSVGTTTTSIESLMVWNGPTSSKMFAAGGGVIYDVSSSSTAGTSVVTGLSEDRWQHTNMTTAAGAFLVLCNGTDTVRNYDGTSWTAPSITGATSSDLIHVNVHKKRLWFVEKDSTKAWYLGTEAISGAATAFQIGSNFNLGGYLVAMATWTVDAGSGPDDLAVFISSRGQMAVYQGTDPSSALTWGLIGVYDLAAPIGRRCFTRFGTSPLLITVSGVLQLAATAKADTSQVAATAITTRILNAMNIAARNFKDNFGWELCVYPRGTRLILNIPVAENDSAKQFVMNTITGAWCEFDAHNANCWAVFNDKLYFGTNTGTVMEADRSGADEYDEIVAYGQTSYQALFAAGNLKRFSMLQPLVTISGDARPAVGISVDFAETSALSTPSGATAGGALWDVAVWDEDVWGGGLTYLSDWTSVPTLGRFSSVKFVGRTGTDAEGSFWGTATWGTTVWGSNGTREQTMQINGFVLLAEVGGHI